MYSQQAIKTLQNHDKSEPLFMMVSFQAPHNPYNKPPEKYFKHYRCDSKINLFEIINTSLGMQKWVIKRR